MTWPLAKNLDCAISDPGDPFFTTWALHWDYYATVSRLALFHAPIFSPLPYTLAFSEHMYGIAALLMPLFAAGIAPLTIHNIGILLAFASSGYALYGLARWITGSTDSAILGGIAFTFVGYRFVHLPHLHFLWVMWLPLLLLAVLAYAAEPRPRNAAFVAATFVMNGLTTLHWLIFGSVAIGATIVLLIALTDRSQRIKFSIRLAIAFGVALAVLLPFIVPYLRVTAMYNMTRLYTDALANSTEWRDWFTPVAQSKLYGRFNRFDAQERVLFPGVITLLLALCGAIGAHRAKLTTRDYASGDGEFRRPSRAVLLTLDVLCGMLAVMSLAGLVAGDVFLFRQHNAFHGVATPAMLLIVVTTVRLWLAYPRWLTRSNGSASLGRTIATSAVPVPLWCLGIWFLIGAFGARGLNGFFHTALFEHFVAFRGIRVPARWIMVAYVALAVFAAIGAKRLLDRQRTRSRRAMLAVVIGAALLFELRAAPIRWYMVPLETRGLYSWLAQQHLQGGVLELPMKQGSAYEYMWRATSHHQPLLNGVSSYLPADYEALSGAYDTTPIPDDFTAALIRHRCSLVLVHEGGLRERSADVRAWVLRETSSGRLAFVRRFDAGTRGDYVFAVTDVEAHADRLRAPAIADPAGRTPAQNADIFMRTGDWTYSGDAFALVEHGPARVVHGRLQVSGWALSPNGIRSVNLRFANGRIVVRATLHPPGDISATLPWYPRVTTPGFAAVMEKPLSGIDGPTDLQIEFIDGDGKRRRNPPYWFRWLPPQRHLPSWKPAELTELLRRLGAEGEHDRIISGEAAIQDFAPALLRDERSETDLAFVTRIAAAMFDDPPPARVSRFMAMLGGGASRNDTLRAMLQSPEFATKYLTSGRVEVREEITPNP